MGLNGTNQQKSKIYTAEKHLRQCPLLIVLWTLCPILNQTKGVKMFQTKT